MMDRLFVQKMQEFVHSAAVVEGAKSVKICDGSSSSRLNKKFSSAIFSSGVSSSKEKGVQRRRR